MHPQPVRGPKESQGQTRQVETRARQAQVMTRRDHAADVSFIISIAARPMKPYGLPSVSCVS
jgi:hypothetical protein